MIEVILLLIAVVLQCVVIFGLTELRATQVQHTDLLLMIEREQRELKNKILSSGN